MNNEEKILVLLSEMKVEMDQRFDKVDQRLDKVDERLDKMDERLDKMDERLDKMDERLDKVDERLDGLKAEMDQRFDKMDERLNELDARTLQMEAVQKEHSELLQKLDARSLQSAVLLETDIPHEIHLVYEGHSVLKKQMDTLATKEQLEKLASDVDVIKKVVGGHSLEIGKLKKAL